MDLKIQYKIALITGSTQGIGFATAKKLCEEGVNVIINGRSKSKVNKAEMLESSLKEEYENSDYKEDMTFKEFKEVMDSSNEIDIETEGKIELKKKIISIFLIL